jgi:hypothetical protein
VAKVARLRAAYEATTRRGVLLTDMAATVAMPARTVVTLNTTRRGVLMMDMAATVAMLGRNMAATVATPARTVAALDGIKISQSTLGAGTPQPGHCPRLIGLMGRSCNHRGSRSRRSRRK